LGKPIPTPLIDSLAEVPGFDKEAFLAVHDQAFPPVSIRFNPAKYTQDPYGFPSVSNQVPWCSTGYYLSERPSFTLDPLFHAGAYYVQEASSMFLEQAITQTCDLGRRLRVLDSCAAPGGKSTLIQQLISAESLLVSNEIIRQRAGILAENITKWGAANAVVTNNDPAHFQKLPGFFDLIVVDAPCSGSGLFRKDPDAIDEWSINNVALCSQRQQRILADLLPALAPGGTLIYSTCSYSPAEDEEIMQWLVKEQQLISVSLQTDPGWQIVETTTADATGYRFYPHKLQGEGFFIACFRKEQGEEFRHQRHKPVKHAYTALLEEYIDVPVEMTVMEREDGLICFPAACQEDIIQLQRACYIRQSGISLGSMARGKLIPDHAWAMSAYRKNAYPLIRLDKQQALVYLRKATLSIEDLPAGWLLVAYEGVILGLIKSMPGRMNNYYPSSWRILNK
jgi:16S rRNA C967 or C1407 C5-methylase (RsmB/RsmF family)/NOL1/NOP2/fmu family ribosome biogenesis protein